MSNRPGEILATLNAFLPSQADLIDVRAALVAMAEVLEEQNRRIRELERWLSVHIG